MVQYKHQTSITFSHKGSKAILRQKKGILSAHCKFIPIQLLIKVKDNQAGNSVAKIIYIICVLQQQYNVLQQP